MHDVQLYDDIVTEIYFGSIKLRVYYNEHNAYSTVSYTEGFTEIKGNGNTWHESVCDWFKSLKEMESK